MDLYYMAASSPCRPVLLTARSLGLKLNKKTVNTMAGEQMKPEFLEINFQHVIPTLVDGDLTLWQSRAICTYLISQYGKDDSLYPKDPKKRALVDRMLYFDYDLLNAVREFGYPILILGRKPDPKSIDNIQKNLATLDKFLEGHDYAAGNSITVADHCLISTVATIEGCGIDIMGHPNVAAWFDRCRENIPGYEEECGIGAKEGGASVKAKLKSFE